MTVSITPCRPGDALATLRDAVGRAKAGRPLAPVAVLVPTNTAGVMARRALGADGGIAAVDTLTTYRLAELLGAPALTAAGRSPVSTPIIDLTVRGVLATAPGSFAPVAAHPSTVVALREVHQELRRAGPRAVEVLASSSARGREVARISRAVTARLAGRWYDEADLMAAATARLASASSRPTVLYLPQRLGVPEVELIRELGRRSDVEVVIALTGDPHADGGTIELAASLAPGWAPSSDVTAAPPPATPATLAISATPAISSNSATRAVVDVESSTDADDEVRHAVRHVLDAARAGTELGRIAVLWPAERPYARLVEHHLRAAGISWNGRPGTLRTERLVPRLLLDLLAVDRRGVRRRELFDLLADVPARRRGGAPVPTAAWERVSRAAGVARDEHWSVRLPAYAAARRARAADGTSAMADHAEDLHEFVRRLRWTLGPPGAVRPWATWATWCEDRVEEWLGRPTLAGLDDAEQQAWEDTARVLDRLRHLDEVSPPVGRHEFRSTLLAELDVAPARVGRIGDGITVGALAGAAGLDVDVVVVLGAADGMLPPPPRTDPLIADDERRAAGLETSDVLGARTHRQFLAVLDSAERVVVTYPRGDLRAATRREPSRWIAAHLGEVRPTHVHSHVAGLMRTAFPTSPAEHRLRALTTAVAAGRRLADEPRATQDPALARALVLRAARAEAILTAFDGDLSGVGVPSLDHAVSPTQLEAWSACPHAYFVRYLLGVREVEEPADEIAITALDRGSALHEALDRFHRAVIAGALPQPGPTGWTPAHAEALGAMFDEVASATELAGRGGRVAAWADERTRMRADLLAWLERDGVQLTRRPATVHSSEWRFGHDGEVTIPLADGRRLAVTGSVDRIDATADGFVVLDHKTGSAWSYRSIDQRDPTAGGTHLQLPAYAAATMALTGRTDAPITAEFAFFGKGDYRRIGYELTPEVWRHVTAVFTEVVAGIESGLFPAVPEPPGWSMRTPCVYCEPDGLGRTELWARWQAKRHDPRLARWFADPESDPDPDPGPASGPAPAVVTGTADEVAT